MESFKYLHGTAVNRLGRLQKRLVPFERRGGVLNQLGFDAVDTGQAKQRHVQGVLDALLTRRPLKSRPHVALARAPFACQRDDLDVIVGQQVGQTFPS